MVALKWHHLKGARVRGDEGLSRLVLDARTFSDAQLFQHDFGGFGEEVEDGLVLHRCEGEPLEFGEGERLEGLRVADGDFFAELRSVRVF